MKKDKMKIKIRLPRFNVINSWTYFLSMFVIFSVCSYLIYCGFTKEKENKNKIEALQKNLYDMERVTFSVVGKIENNRLAVRIGNARTIYTLKVSTTDYWNLKEGDKISRILSNEELLMMTDNGYYKLEEKEKEISSLRGELYYIFAFILLIFYAAGCLSAALNCSNMFKDSRVSVVLVWIWFLVLVGFLIRSIVI